MRGIRAEAVAFWQEGAVVIAYNHARLAIGQTLDHDETTGFAGLNRRTDFGQLEPEGLV